MSWHSYRDTLDWHNVTLSEAEDRACQYLENNGFRFLIDFGYSNAVEKARQHWKTKKSPPRSPLYPYPWPQTRL